MAYVKYQLTIPQLEDVNGNPAVGHTINSYVWNTSTPAPMYTSSDGAGAATSLTLNSLGQPQTAGGTACDIFLDDTIVYKIIQKDTNGAQVGATIGPVYSSGFLQSPRVFDQQTITATASQTIFNLNFVYASGGNSMAVYKNGLRLVKTVDFVETSTTSVTLTLAAQAGDEYTFIGGQDVSSSFSSSNVSFLQAGTGAVTQSVQTKLRDAVSVKDFGAAGDGVTDDTAAIQAAIDAAYTLGGSLVVPAGVYNVSDTLTISSSIKIFGYGAKIDYTGNDNGLSIIEITSSNVSIYGLEVQGLTVDVSTTERLGSHLIYAHGVDNEGSLAAPTYINDVHVIDCKLHDTKRTAVFYEFVDRGSVVNCEIHDVQYAGFEGLSCNRVRVSNNHVRTIGASGAVIGDNAYGITFGRQVNPATTLTTHPPSKYLIISDNMVNGVPTWEGIDTHGAHHVTIVGNQVRNVNMGIVVTRDKDATTERNAPKYTTISGNAIETIGSPNNAAIIVAGAAGASIGLTNDFAYGIVVTGNTIEGGGDASDSSGLNGAIYCRNTYGLVVSDNTINRPRSSGIILHFDNYGFMVGSNNIFDPYGSWANCAGVNVRDQYNEGTIDRNNVYRQATGIGTYVAIYAVYMQTATNCNVRIHDGFDNTLNGSLTAAAATKSSPRRSEIKEVSVAANTGSYTTDVTWTFDKPFIDAKVTATYRGNPYSGANAIGVAIAGFTTSGGKQVSCTVRFYLPSTAMTFSAGTLIAHLEASET